MKKTNLVNLMQRYITGQVSEQEKKKIEAWLDVKKTEEGTGMILEPEDEERLFRKITSNIDSPEDVKAFRPGRARIRTLFSNRWLQVAATLLILVAASYSIWLINARDAVHNTITGNKMEKVILEDGTLVWLRKQSQLTYVNKGAARNATFAGEAFFEVAKDPARPFTVTCGKVTVKVLGTSFNLKTTEEKIEVRVLTGNVNLSWPQNKTGVDLTANEIATYTAQGKITKATMSQDQATLATSDTEYDMEFRNTSMEIVILRIEKKFDVQVDVENSLLNKCRITADFTDHSLDSTLSMIAELLDIDYSIKKSAVTISGTGCD